VSHQDSSNDADHAAADEDLDAETLQNTAADDRVAGVEASAELAAELINKRTEVTERNTWGGEKEIADVDPADPSEVATEVARRTVGAEHVVELDRQPEHEDAPVVELDVIVFDGDDRELVVRPTTTHVRNPSESGTEIDDEHSTLPYLSEPPRYDVERDANPEEFTRADKLRDHGGGLGAEIRGPNESSGNH